MLTQSDRLHVIMTIILSTVEKGRARRGAAFITVAQMHKVRCVQLAHTRSHTPDNFSSFSSNL